MSLQIASLNSGSNGNCYYIGTTTEAVLIDAGIPCREIEKRMKRLQLSLQRVKAVFVTHEHGDHIHGVPALARKHNIPVYITPDTLKEGNLKIPEPLVNSFSAYQAVAIGGLNITPFPKYHDAADPHSFIVEHQSTRVGVFTDIGLACRHVIYHFQQCHAAFLESNYDAELLESGSYPPALKSRIRGGRGHLSNAQALKLFLQHRPPYMSHLILSHLSRNNNKPELVEALFRPYAGTFQLEIASRYRESAVFTVEGGERSIHEPPKLAKARQLSLFS
jgi:phosphoribosyl 1,2-cyclic phosphodiesterase